MTTSMTAIADTILVATSTGSMGASHTGLGVHEYGFSMRGNTLGVSTHGEPFLYTPWGFPEHGGLPASYTPSQEESVKLVKEFTLYIFAFLLVKYVTYSVIQKVCLKFVCVLN